MPFDFPASPSNGQQYTPAGGPTYQWNGVSWNIATLPGGYVSKAGDTMTGDLNIAKSNPALLLDKKASGEQSLLAGSLLGKKRWGLTLGGTNPESGGNAGSNFNFDRYDDAGNYLATALNIDRQSGNMLTQGNLTLDKANPDLVFNKKASGQFARIGSLVNGTDRWWLHLGNPDAEVDPADGSNFVLYAYRNNGSSIGEALRITRSNMLAAFGGDVTVAGLLSEQGHRVVRKDGDTMTGGLVATSLISKSAMHGVVSGDTGAAGMNSGLWMYDQGKPRWAFYKHGGAESTGNVGSDLRLDRMDDAGNSLGALLTFSRASGLVTLSSGQLQFPATPNPSTGVNVLDEYKETDWVPDLRFGNANVGVAYTRREGRAIKIGKKVSWWVGIKLSAKGTSVGIATLVGLPFPSMTVPPTGQMTYFGGSVGYMNAMAASVAGVGIIVPSSSTGVNFYMNLGTATTQLTDAHFTAAAQFEISGTYEASS